MLTRKLPSLIWCWWAGLCFRCWSYKRTTKSGWLSLDAQLRWRHWILQGNSSPSLGGFPEERLMGLFFTGKQRSYRKSCVENRMASLCPMAIPKGEKIWRLTTHGCIEALEVLADYGLSHFLEQQAAHARTFVYPVKVKSNKRAVCPTACSSWCHKAVSELVGNWKLGLLLLCAGWSGSWRETTSLDIDSMGIACSSLLIPFWLFEGMSFLWWWLRVKCDAWHDKASADLTSHLNTSAVELWRCHCHPETRSQSCSWPLLLPARAWSVSKRLHCRCLHLKGAFPSKTWGLQIWKAYMYLLSS